MTAFNSPKVHSEGASDNFVKMFKTSILKIIVLGRIYSAISLAQGNARIILSFSTKNAEKNVEVMLND